MQIYGIDLAKNKFDVSFFSLKDDGTPDKKQHKVVSNNEKDITKFLKKVSKDAILVAEHTGVYGDLLLKLCNDNGIRISFVSSLTIHNYRCTQDREKTDLLDCESLRDYGERFEDKLNESIFDSPEIYELRQLALQRQQYVEMRKKLMTIEKTEDIRPVRCHDVKERNARMIKILDEEISCIEKEMRKVMDKDESLKRHCKIIESVKGVGIVTMVELIVKTNNFKDITTARQFASYAGIAPCRKESGNMCRKTHISTIGCRRSKSLLYTCARTASMYNDKIKLYYERKTTIDKKPHFYVLNAIANKLLRIIFSLIKKDELYNMTYVQKDVRKKEVIYN